jgi:hypothetical protein
VIVIRVTSIFSKASRTALSLVGWMTATTSFTMVFLVGGTIHVPTPHTEYAGYLVSVAESGVGPWSF